MKCLASPGSQLSAHFRFVDLMSFPTSSTLPEADIAYAGVEGHRPQLYGAKVSGRAGILQWHSRGLGTQLQHTAFAGK